MTELEGDDELPQSVTSKRIRGAHSSAAGPFQFQLPTPLPLADDMVLPGEAGLQQP